MTERYRGQREMFSATREKVNYKLLIAVVNSQIAEIVERVEKHGVSPDIRWQVNKIAAIDMLQKPMSREHTDVLSG